MNPRFINTDSVVPITFWQNLMLFFLNEGSCIEEHQIKNFIKIGDSPYHTPIHYIGIKELSPHSLLPYFINTLELALRETYSENERELIQRIIMPLYEIYAHYNKIESIIKSITDTPIKPQNPIITGKHPQDGGIMQFVAGQPNPDTCGPPIDNTQPCIDPPQTNPT